MFLAEVHWEKAVGKKPKKDRAGVINSSKLLYYYSNPIISRLELQKTLITTYFSYILSIQWRESNII